MTQTASLEGASPPPSAATLLATWPAGSVERRIALVVVLLSLALLAAVAPFAKQQLPQVWAFIPVYEAALIVVDLVTALLLFGQFRISRSKAVLTLAGGYFFSALLTVAHGLSFPGLFTPTGLLGAGPQTTAWLYMFWHAGFPLFVIGYAVLRGSPGDTMPAGQTRGSAVAGVFVTVTAFVLACVLLAFVGHDALPAIMQGNRYTPTMIVVVSIVWLASLAAVALLWRRRPLSVLDLWLIVVMCAWLSDIALSAMLNAGRFDLGFYFGRVYGLFAASFVLGVLLLENGVLHARLTEAHAHERQRASDLLLLSERLESLNGQIVESNRQLQEQTRLKSEFLANMSHELRTPLNAIIGFSEMLKDGLAGDQDNQRRFAGHVFESGHHLLDLINDILDLSKIEAGKVELALDNVPLDGALADAVAMVATQAEAKGIRLQVDRGHPAGLLRADRRRLKQILLNLLSNATKFTPMGGLVTIGASVVDRSRAVDSLPGFRQGMRLPLPANEFERFVEISVFDTGIGIAADDMRRLFTPFTQISNSLTRSVEGTGLGLVMVHRLAELHGGTVAVTSEPGQGSCFTVWLPSRDDADAASRGLQAVMPQPASEALALVVEDNEAAATLMRVQLEEQGFVVRQVASAEAALALVHQCVPALITLDILLPGMDGWEFMERLRETPRWEAVPVVVVSVVADQGRGFSLGAALVLQKPIGRDALAKGLERLNLVPSAEREVTVLVIDDDPDAVELLANQLHQRRYIVLRALGGREGIELARRFKPDLIALDLEMPEVNGFEVVEALKANASTSHIPIVVVTSKDLTAADRTQLNGHILDIVGKAEFNHGRFIGEVQRALSRQA
jgi:signal transduction histidine kinase/DNA-binding response OmpR family regulator